MKIREYKVAGLFCCDYCFLTIFGNILKHFPCREKHMFGEESTAQAFSSELAVCSKVWPRKYLDSEW